jgi:FkbM family methyltransferase
MPARFTIPDRHELWRWQVERRLLPFLVRPDAGRPVTPVADTVLPEWTIAADWVCYCGGVGEDIRFELELARRWGVHVHLFDPTPRSIAFIEAERLPAEQYTFLPVGLWSEDATLHFAAPQNEEYVSHTVMEGDTWPGFDAQCRSIPSLMRELGHDRVDLLKMNIEGAEGTVLDAALAAGIRPGIITLTWEGDGAFRKAIDRTSALRSEGYAFVGRNAWFFTYVDEERLRAAPAPVEFRGRG